MTPGILRPGILFLFIGVSLELLFFSFPTWASGYPLPFDPFLSPESFGCKRLLIPGSELLPRNPVIDARVPAGWREVPMKKGGSNRTVESLVIKGSAIGHKKDASGTVAKEPLIVIPAGGLVYDATPLETHLPVGERGVIFGKESVLEKKEMAEETVFSVNGRPYTGHGGIDGLFGKGRAIDGIKNTLAVLAKIRGS